jgi:hypothetical protein
MERRRKRKGKQETVGECRTGEEAEDPMEMSG